MQFGIRTIRKKILGERVDDAATPRWDLPRPASVDATEAARDIRADVVAAALRLVDLPSRYSLEDERLEAAFNEAGRNAVKARTGSAVPLRSFGPRSSTSNRLPSSFRVPSAITTAFGSAILYSRAAKFGVSPTIPRSCASPDPIKSLTTCSPVATPTRV
jgi:hypothetical protein